MTERHKQLQTELANRDLFQQAIVADYFFLKTLLFARKNLNEEEYRLFQRLFQVLNGSFPQPNLLVYLHRPVEALLAQIRKRARPFEGDISAAYLERIQTAYFEFFRNPGDTPVLIIDLEDVDFESDPANYRHIQGLLTRAYPPGVHRVALQDGSREPPP